MCLSLS